MSSPAATGPPVKEAVTVLNVLPETIARPRRGLLPVLAIACGLAVSNVYFPQALTTLIGEDLGAAAGTAATVATAAQLGYALGIFLVVPLGDRLDRRRLVLGLIAAVSGALLLAAAAPNLPVLIAASAAVGVVTVVPQVVVPMAAGLAPAHRRGRTVSAVQSGLLAGILLARAFGGFLGGLAGWRAVYLGAAGLMVVLFGVLFRMLPGAPPPVSEPYPRLLASLWHLLRTEPGLRRSCLYGATLFGAFSAVWTDIALLLAGPGYRYGPGAVGVLALVGAASVAAMPAAGRACDRWGPDRVNLLCVIGTLLALAVLWYGDRGLVALVPGVLLLDVAVQAGQVANQARVFAIGADVRSRVNTVYMTATFLGGSAGSWLGTRAWEGLGWQGVCAAGAAPVLLALVVRLTRRARTHPSKEI